MRQERGFTLLEVMVALAVLATALIMLLHVRNQGIRLAEESRRLTEATLLASWRLGEIEAVGSLEVGERTGDFGNDYPGYTWQVVIQEVGTPMLSRTFREVRVTVSWDPDRPQRSVTLVEYVPVR